MSFRPKNDNFVPDKRCSGWWTTNIVEFHKPSEGKRLIFSKLDLDALLNANLKNLLDVYCRYRIYALDNGELQMSVREEDVDHVCDALYNFVLQRPAQEHFLLTKIGSERSPYSRDLLPEIRDLLHNYDFKTILASESTDPEQIIKRNYVSDMVNVLTNRIIVDYPQQHRRDNFIRSMCSQLLLFPCTCSDECVLRCYRQIWDFQELLEKKGTRKSVDRERVLGRFYNLTEEELEDRLMDDPDEFIAEIGGSVNSYEKPDGLYLPILPDYTDNQPLRNADVHYGRGLYLSHSTTYADWKEEKPKEKKTSDTAPNEQENLCSIELAVVTKQVNQMRKISIFAQIARHRARRERRS